MSPWPNLRTPKLPSPGAITQVGKDWTITGEHIAKWANEIEADTEAAFDDKAIVEATNTLIRYGKVSEETCVQRWR